MAQSEAVPFATLIPLVDSFFYAAPKKLKRGGYAVYVVKNANSRTKIRFQAGTVDKPCTAPFGVSEPMEGNDNNNKRALQLNAGDPAVIELLKNLDIRTISVARDNVATWFPKKVGLDPAGVEAMYMHIVGQPKDSYPPVIRTKIMINNEDPEKDTKVYVTMDEGKTLQKGSWLDIDKFSQVLPILDIAYVWFTAMQFGVTLLVDQILVYKTAVKTGPQFLMNGKVPLIKNAPSDPEDDVDAYEEAGEQRPKRAKSSVSTTPAVSVPVTSAAVSVPVIAVPIPCIANNDDDDSNDNDNNTS